MNHRNQHGSVMKGWHLDKRVSVGHIVTTAIALVAAISFGMKLQAQIDANKKAIEVESQLRSQTIAAQSARMDRVTRSQERALEHIREALVRVEEKLDKLRDERRDFSR